MYEAELGYNASIGVGVDFNNGFIPLMDNFYISVNIENCRTIKVRMSKDEAKQIRDTLNRYIRDSEV